MSASATTTRTVGNVIAGEERPARERRDVREARARDRRAALARRALGRATDVDAAITAAVAAQPAWARETPADARRASCAGSRSCSSATREEIAAIVAAETGKSPKDALGETGGAIEMGYFVAGEGRRFYGRTTHARGAEPPGDDRAPAARRRRPDHRRQHADRERRLEGLPGAAVRQRRRAEGARGHAGDRAGVRAARRRGRACPRACSTSSRASARRPGSRSSRTRASPSSRFTGSTAVGRMIARVAGERLAKVCLELGGKNPLVVCDDADLEAAAEPRRRCRAFSNAGQRCAAGSRIIVFDAVYDRFSALLLERTDAQRVGPTDEHDFGPVINERQLEQHARRGRARPRPAGATVLAGGERHRRRPASTWRRRSSRAPTTLIGARSSSARSRRCTACASFDEAVDARERHALRADRGDLDGLACTAGRSSSRGSRAASRSVNGPTYGSEPHMPFGGLRRLRHRLARAGHRGARRLLGLEDGLRQPRSVAGV